MGVKQAKTLYSPAEMARRICLREKRKGNDLDITQVISVLRHQGDLLLEETEAGRISGSTWLSITLSNARKRAGRK